MPLKDSTANVTAAAAFQLTDIERMLLVLYRAVPITVRAELGERLFYAWTHPPPSERESSALRYKEAAAHFQAGLLTVDVFDDLQAGEAKGDQ